MAFSLSPEQGSYKNELIHSLTHCVSNGCPASSNVMVILLNFGVHRCFFVALYYYGIFILISKFPNSLDS